MSQDASTQTPAAQAAAAKIAMDLFWAFQPNRPTRGTASSGTRRRWARNTALDCR